MAGQHAAGGLGALAQAPCDTAASVGLAGLMCLPGAGQGWQYSAEDAESCCGEESSQYAGEDEVAPGLPPPPQQPASASCACPVRPPALGQAACTQLDRAGSGASDASTRLELDGDGDDFEALEPAALLEDDDTNHCYPGGVDAALADWQAAVSSLEHAPTSSGTSGPDGSVCCGWLPDWHAPCSRQRPPTAAWHKQQQPPWQRAGSSAAALPSRAAVLMSPSLAGLPAPPPGFAGAPATLLPRCEWGAFEGDRIGDVLAGRLPAPSCDSCDCLLMPAAVDDCVMAEP